MDQLRICSDFMKGLIAKFVTKKLSKYVEDIKIENIQIDRRKDGGYRLHVNGDIYVSDQQVSQFLHNL